MSFTHGAEIRDPKPFVQAYIDHRLERERQILVAYDGLETIPTWWPRLCRGSQAPAPAAGRSMLAHLVQFVAEGRVLATAADHRRPLLL